MRGRYCSTAVQSFVSTRLDYCNNLMCGIADGLMQRLRAVQNTATRLITGARRRDHISPVLRQLYWLPVRQRVQFKLAVLVFKALQCSLPLPVAVITVIWGKLFLQPVKSKWACLRRVRLGLGLWLGLRLVLTISTWMICSRHADLGLMGCINSGPSSDAVTCLVPWTSTCVGDRAFDLDGPRLWNALPISLSLSVSLTSPYWPTGICRISSRCGLNSDWNTDTCFANCV